MNQRKTIELQENLDTILIEKGFHPIDNINTCDVNINHDNVCKYIRTITNKGNPVIVEVEKEWVDGDIETHDDEEELAQLFICTSDRKICSSFDGKVMKIKREEIELPIELDMNLDGLGYCTPDGMCIVTRDIDEPYITVRTDIPMEFGADNVELSQINMHNSLPIPIVKASTILSNNKLVIDDINDKSKPMIDRYVMVNADILDKLKKTEEKANNLYKLWDNKITSIIDNLINRIKQNELKIQNKTYISNDQYIEIIKQINDDYLLLNRISIQISDITTYNDKLEALSLTLSSFIEIIDRI
jgi:hypothetical protein